VEDVADDQRLEHIQLEVAIGAANSHGNVVAHHLCAHHGDRLALSGVDFARHDGASRLILGERELTKAAARTGAQEADVVGNFHDGDSSRIKGTRKVDKRILCSEGLKFVVSGLERVSSFLLQVLSNCLSKASVGVEACADSSATLGDLVDVLEGLNDAFLALLKLIDVGRELLTEGKGSCILGVRAADLDDVVELVALGCEGVLEATELGQKTLVGLHHGSNVDN